MPGASLTLQPGTAWPAVQNWKPCILPQDFGQNFVIFCNFKLFLMFKPFYYFIFIVVLVSCKKVENSNAFEEILYENHDGPSKSFFGNNVEKNSIIGLENKIVKDLFSSPSWNNLNSELKNKVVLKEVRYTKYNHTNFELIEIGIDNAFKESLMIFKSGNNYSILKSDEQLVNSGGDKKFIMKTLEDKVLFSMVYNSKLQLLKFENNDFESFSKRLYAENTEFKSEKGFRKTQTKLVVSEEKTCMEKTKSFGDCMVCAINECANDFPCNVTCAIWTKSCLAGFALACAIY